MRKKLLIIIFAVTIFLPLSKTHAARLWSSGMELQSVTAGVEFTATGSPTIDTTTKRSGAASLRCNPTAATAYIYRTFYPAAEHTADIYARTYVYIATAPHATELILDFSNLYGYFNYGIPMDSSRRLILLDSHQYTDDTSAALNAAEWYRVEISYISSTAATEVKIYDSAGNLFDTLTGNSDYANDDPYSMDVGLVSSATADLYFDDIAITDNAGSYQ